jgi:hypothetical protein
MPHIDTPVDAKFFIGTVVVCLPSKFSGGELVVSHGNTSQTFDFAALSSEQNLYQFAAFYGDCLHEIKPVKEGHMITLMYHILREDPNCCEDAEKQVLDWPRAKQVGLEPPASIF